jgi:hypothetical protein
VWLSEVLAPGRGTGGAELWIRVLGGHHAAMWGIALGEPLATVGSHVRIGRGTGSATWSQSRGDLVFSLMTLEWSLHPRAAASSLLRSPFPGLAGVLGWAYGDSPGAAGVDQPVPYPRLPRLTVVQGLVCPLK